MMLIFYIKAVDDILMVATRTREVGKFTVFDNILL